MSVGTTDQFRAQILAAGTMALRPKHPGVNPDNILTNPIYRSALKVMIEESIAKGNTNDGHVMNLLADIRRMEGISTS